LQLLQGFAPRRAGGFGRVGQGFGIELVVLYQGGVAGIELVVLALPGFGEGGALRLGNGGFGQGG